jgi:hypothetical protein
VVHAGQHRAKFHVAARQRDDRQCTTNQIAITRGPQVFECKIGEPRPGLTIICSQP